MTEPKAPKIEFPCENYPVKVMGVATDVYREAVLAIMQAHAGDFDTSKVIVKPSSAGTYQSITVFITATGEAQLTTIFEDLKKLPETRMVL